MTTAPDVPEQEFPDATAPRAAGLVEPLELVDFDGDRIRFTRYAGRRFGIEVETAPPVDDGGFELRVILGTDHARQLRDWLRAVLPPEPDDPQRQLDEAHEPSTFTFRPAGEHHDVTVALHSLADCAICERNIPAGSFVVVHPDDDGPDRWAHESCAHPDQPPRAPLTDVSSDLRDDHGIWDAAVSDSHPDQQRTARS